MKAERKDKHNSKNLKIPRSPLAVLFSVLFLAVAALFSSCALVSEATEDNFLSASRKRKSRWKRGRRHGCI